MTVRTEKNEVSKIPQNFENKPGAIFFNGPFWEAYFWRGLYSEELIYEGEICVSKSTGIAL